MSVLSSLRVLPVLITATAVCAAAALGYAAWQYYMGSPWTRDGAVRAYVVKVAPQVAGEIVQLPVADNQFVHKGDLLMLIDPTNYSIAVRQAEAAVEQARAVADNARAQMVRRQSLSDVAVTMEERQTYISQAAGAEANYQSALASLDQARVNFKRTQVRSPVNGFITNLTAQLGDYANVGSLQLSVVNSDSFWVDAYFEETALGRIQDGDAATIKLMGYGPVLHGRVQGLSRGINVPNAQSDASGLASVNPIFTFVRLAQRVPVRIRLDETPPSLRLVAGLTATVQIEPYKAPPIPGAKPSAAGVSKAAPEPGQLQTLAEAAARQAPSQAAARAHVSHPAGQPAAIPSRTEAAPGPAPPPSPAPTPLSTAERLPALAPLSGQASAAAAAASADLRALEAQIAANPPSGAAPSAGPANGRKGANADLTPTSQYLGRTYDLFGDRDATPAPKPRAPEPIRRRARSRWRHY